MKRSDALIDNALKYTQDDGHVEIQVRGARPTASEALEAGSLAAGDTQLPDSGRKWRYIEVVVRDDGQGIPHESQPYIFDAFHRVETGLTRAVEGLGLGLGNLQAYRDDESRPAVGGKRAGRGQRFSYAASSVRGG